MSSHDTDLEKGTQNTEHADVSRVENATLEDGRQIILIGNTRVYKDELARAFGGTLNPGLSVPTKLSKNLANAGPLGLSAFALTTFVLSLVNARAMGVKIPNVVAGLAFFYGGAVQVIAGVLEYVSGNTFACCAFCSYGGFWISYAAILTEAFGIGAAYAEDTGTQMADGVGFFLIGWALFTFMVWLCTIRSTWAFTSLFFLLFVTFLLLACGELGPSVGSTRAGGVTGVIVAFIAWYNAYAGLSNKENSYITVKPIYLPGSSSKI